VLRDEITGSGFSAAIVLVVVIFMMPVFFRDLRRSPSILVVYWFVIFLHQTVAFTNAFLIRIFGARDDADRFNRVAEEFALKKFGVFDYAGRFHDYAEELERSWQQNWSIGGHLYQQVLGGIYKLFGPSYLLGEQFSILAFSISFVVLIKIMRQFELSQYLGPSLFLFGALPSMVFLGSVTLRESFQVLFFIITVYFGLKMHLKGGLNAYPVAMVLSAILMGITHKGLIVYALFLIVLFFVWSYQPISTFRNLKKYHLAALFFIPIFIACMFFVSSIRSSSLVILVNLFQHDMLIEAANFRKIAAITRASYSVPLDLSSFSGAFYSSFSIYLHYLFAPFPWHIRSWLDIFAFFESILRLLLVCYSVKSWLNAIGNKKRLIGLMLILYFSMTFMWSMGTTNYGTAIRHHMISGWILVILGLPLLIDSIKHRYFSFRLASLEIKNGSQMTR
jgi:hypothetical protein